MFCTTFTTTWYLFTIFVQLIYSARHKVVCIYVLLLWCVVALGAPSISMTKTIPFYSAQMGLFSKAKVIFSSVVFICKMIKKTAKQKTKPKLKCCSCSA